MTHKVHARIAGKTYAWDAAKLGGRELTDAQLKREIARWLDMPERQLGGYVVDRPDTGHLIVRPQAVYG